MWYDLHAHLDKLPEGVETSIQLAQEMGVEKIITIGTEPSDLPTVLKIAEEYPGLVYCTLGIHPHEGVVYSDQVEQFIQGHLHRKDVVAVGEIGLDYYYQHSSRTEQLEAFNRQMEIAAQYKLPVEIHTRDAESDTIEILNKYKGRVTGLIHCFTGTQWLAEKALDLGYNLSFSGIVTFKNAQALRDVVIWTPLDRMHVETDAPFLAPVPMRGKSNTPAFVAHTGAFLSELKKMSEEEFAQQMKVNAHRVFPRLGAS